MSTVPSALLLTGAVGSGKTTLATEIGELLREADTPHAVIELDWLAWCSAPQGNAGARRRLVVENLACMVRNFEAEGICRLVLAGSIVSEQHLGAIRSTLGAMEMTVVRLTAPAELLVKRVASRDVTRMTLESVDQAQAFITTTHAAVPDCLEAENDDRPVGETARLILRRIGWATMESADA